MSSLFSLLRFKCLQFELCNLIWRRTRPVTQPQEGRLTHRLLSRRSMLSRPPHALIFHLLLICAHLLFPALVPLPLNSCCLSFNPGLIPHYCLIIHEQTRPVALSCFCLLCECRLFIDRLGAGSHAGLLFLELGERV